MHLTALSRLISDLYAEKHRMTVTGALKPEASLVDFIHQEFLRRFGLKHLADEHIHVFIASIEKNKSNRKVSLRQNTVFHPWNASREGSTLSAEEARGERAREGSLQREGLHKDMLSRRQVLLGR